MVALTAAEPAWVDPANHRSTPLAAPLSETISIWRMRTSRAEPRTGVPSVLASAVTAIASFSAEAAGNVAFAFQAAPAPVPDSRRRCRPCRENEVASPRTSRSSTASLTGAYATAAAATRGTPKTCGTVAALRLPAPFTGDRHAPRSHAPAGRLAAGSAAAAGAGRRAVRPATRTITRVVPGAALPTTSPYESSYAAGCAIAGGGRGGAVSTAAP